MQPTLSLELELLADYFQFYLQDEGSQPALVQWTPAELEALLAISEGEIVVGTARNMLVPVSISIFSAAPALLGASPRTLSMVNECELLVRSGKIIVAGLNDYQPKAVRLAVSPGWYQVRIYYYNLEGISEDGLEGTDTYTVHLWPVADSGSEA